MLSSELEDRDKSGKLGDIIDAIRDLLNGKYNTYIKKDERFYHIRKCYSKFRQEFEEKMDAIIEKDKLDVELTEINAKGWARNLQQLGQFQESLLENLIECQRNSSRVT